MHPVTYALAVVGAVTVLSTVGVVAAFLAAQWQCRREWSAEIKADRQRQEEDVEYRRRLNAMIRTHLMGEPTDPVQQEHVRLMTDRQRDIIDLEVQRALRAPSAPDPDHRGAA